MVTEAGRTPDPALAPEALDRLALQLEQLRQELLEGEAQLTEDRTSVV